MKAVELAFCAAALALVVGGCASTNSSSSTASSSTPARPTPSVSTSAPVPDPSLAEATTVISGLYTALAQRNPTLRDTYIVPTVKPKVTTDVVDTLGASTVAVSDVQAIPAPELGPGTAKFSAIVTFTQDDGDKQVERDWFVVENTPTGLKLVDTGQSEIISAMPADPTPTAAPEQSAGGNQESGGQSQTGMCHFNEGAGMDVPCDSPYCDIVFPGGGQSCTPASYLRPRRDLSQPLGTSYT